MRTSLRNAALVISVAVGAMTLPTAANAYTFATSSCSINTDGWCLGGGNLNGYRNAVTNTANFGPGGVVGSAVTFNQLNSVTAATLAGANGFVSTWWSDSESASSVAAIVNFFLSGGDLFLMQDDTGHDAIGAGLGLATVDGSAGSPSNGVSPLFSGPFGTATNVTQTGNTGYLNAAAVAAANGTIGGVNASGQITSAYWAAGQYAAGAGRLVILGDVDMVSDYGTAIYAPLNENGRFALNSTAYFVNNATGVVPEPATWAMMLFGFGSLGFAMRRRPAVRARIRFA